MNHPSELKLERHLLDPGRSPIAGHVAGCDRCRDRLLEMEKQAEDFRRFVYPATLEDVSRRRWTPWRTLWLLAPAAGLAAVLLIVRAGPTSGETVPASASLRFRVRTSQPCALTLLSVDAAGEVSKLYAQEVRDDVTLPGGVRLDGSAGPERFFAVCDPGYDDVERAARRIAPSVRQKNALPDVQGPQASLLIEKIP